MPNTVCPDGGLQSGERPRVSRLFNRLEPGVLPANGRQLAVNNPVDLLHFAADRLLRIAVAEGQQSGLLDRASGRGCGAALPPSLMIRVRPLSGCVLGFLWALALRSGDGSCILILR